MVFAIPTYVFVVSMIAMVGIGVVHGIFWGWPHAIVPARLPVGSASAVGLFVLLRAFASGCSALTGVEAISNGVPAFRAPSARNAGQTLLIMGAIAVFLFMGVSVLAWKFAAAPSGQMSVLSQVARTVYSPGSVLSAGFYVVQASTFAVLFLAANASFQGFPRLTAMLARDGFAPRQLQNLGDRLVYSNGLAVLSLLACALIVGFNASINSLIHLYLLGVFIAFTLSQIGMVVRTVRTRQRLGSRVVATRIALNGTGAVLTGLVAVITVVTKFQEGAWMVTIAIPVLVISVPGHQAPLPSRGTGARPRLPSVSRSAARPRRAAHTHNRRCVCRGPQLCPVTGGQRFSRAPRQRFGCNRTCPGMEIVWQ